MTQRELADACGWSNDSDTGQSRISSYESGRRDPGINELLKIAKATNSPLDGLINGVDDSLSAQVLNKMKKLNHNQQEKVLAALDSLIDAFRE